MPSVRASHKRCVATWVPVEVKRKLEKRARDQGIPLSELVEQIYRQHLDATTHPKKHNTTP